MGDSESEGFILDSDNYEGGINKIEIAHERTKQRTDALAAGGGRSGFAVGIRKINSDCANRTPRRDIRWIGSRANF